MLNSPYAVAKAGVESLGRALRAELAPLGASASVAYFGWVDTRLVQDAFDTGTTRDRIQREPARLPAEADHARGGRRPAIVRGIEERAPRIFAPQVVALRLRPARH